MDVKVPPPRPTFSHSTSLSSPLSPPLLPSHASATIGHHGLFSATAGRSSRGAAVDVDRDFGVIEAERTIIFADSFLYRSYMLAMLLPFSTNTCSYSTRIAKQWWWGMTAPDDQLVLRTESLHVTAPTTPPGRIIA